MYCHFECLRSTDELVSWPKRWCRAAGRAVSWLAHALKRLATTATGGRGDALFWPLAEQWWSYLDGRPAGSWSATDGGRTAGFDATRRPPCTRPSGRERMVASSVIVTQSHSVKTTTFTYRLTPTQYPFIIMGGSVFPFTMNICFICVEICL